jgi:hypothetical protein
MFLDILEICTAVAATSRRYGRREGEMGAAGRASGWARSRGRVTGVPAPRWRGGAGGRWGR